ncbi:uncharacterized protein LOC122654245 isoform X2 [Telopea speciosissima]|uniref:uncharacterized protein LOC122654245 isoform X2 n=1 Tax=Telopea speciosissima TaxID=54955 RepID=UPI001CC53C9E|nr:uncharacterized protein LOC122654245 isoform X2 [Telopea speciosissima]
MIPKVSSRLPKRADTVLEKNEKRAETSSIITYQRKKKVINIKTYQRKKRKSSCSLLNIMEPDKVIQTVQNSSMGLSAEESKGKNNRNNRETKGELEPVTEGCNIFSKGNLEVSVTKSKMEEMHPSCDVNVMKDDVSVGSINKEAYVLEKLPSLPGRSPHCSRRKLLILDLNGLLVDIVPFIPNGYTPDKKIAYKSLFKRPFYDDFLKFCFERFEVGVWSSRNKRNVDSVIDFLMEDMKHKLLFCWDQSHCTETGFNTIENKQKPLVLKELKKLWDKHDPNLPWEKGVYNESNTLLVDDSPYKALCNPPHTAIFPYPFTYLDRKDNSLGPGGDLRVYLEGLAMAEEIKKYLEEHPFGQRAITSKNPSWDFYLRVIGTKISDVQLEDNVDSSSLTSSQELCKLSSKC